MNRAVGFIVAAALAGSACGDNLGPPPLTSDQLLDRLRALPGVRASDAGHVPGFGTETYSYYILHFTQPIDHDDPSLGVFDQQVSLLHRNEQAPTPMIVDTSGYADEYGNQPGELALMLDANQVSIEHRFFGTSRPKPPADWSKLDIRQMALDEEAVISALHTVYGGAFVTTGASKGGMTAVFHRSWFPESVQGTVAYVAPISFSAPDPRYQGTLDAIGRADCRNGVRALASRALQHSPQMQDQASQEGNSYTRVAIGPATEAAIAELEWSFWQLAASDACDNLLSAETATDAQLYAFLNQYSKVSDYDDEQVRSYEGYYYQMYSELGYPENTASYLSADLSYKESDYAGELPCPEPNFDPSAMTDVVTRVQQSEVQNMVFVYGGRDPWTTGAFPTGDFAHKYTVPDGNHFSKLLDLDQGDRDAALAYVQEWTGVTPVVTRAWQREAAGERTTRRAVAAPRRPRLPPPPVRTAPR